MVIPNLSEMILHKTSPTRNTARNQEAVKKGTYKARRALLWATPKIEDCGKSPQVFVGVPDSRLIIDLHKCLKGFQAPRGLGTARK